MMELPEEAVKGYIAAFEAGQIAPDTVLKLEVYKDGRYKKARFVS